MKLVCLTLVLGALSSFSASALEALPKDVPTPADNPKTAIKVELGKALYFDPRLSIDGTVSCNSCHNVMASGEDNRPVSVGVNGQRGGRSAPTVWNSGHNTVQFWDGRAASLEDQAKGPLTNPIEMGMPNHDAVMARVKQLPGYVEMFKKAFPKDKEPVTIDNLAKAIATFERTLNTPDSAFDLYKRGNKKAMSAQAIRGMKLVEEIGCTACHTGKNFNGEGLKMGEGNYQLFPQAPGSKFDKQYNLTADLGRYEVTKNPEDKHKWRVPTWRNVALTAPYFHNGSVKTLDEAVRVMGKTQLDMDLSEDQVGDIVAFLNSLTGKLPKIVAPQLPMMAGGTLTPEK
ncbi:MAG: cytochrome-c peroxidase [Bacteriovoracaceae bacterium]|nr:cytochrome-c peroxidase [Bacteriovoracaceae bacterium]